MITRTRTGLCVRAQQQRNDASSRLNAFTSTVQGRVQLFRKKVEDSRGPAAKDNLNKFIAIATADAKFVSDFVKDLDQFHKDVFESLKTSTSTKPEDTSIEVVRDETNVFK